MKSLTVGSHRFQVTLPSYKEEEETVNISEGFQMNVTVKLAKQKVAQSTDSDAEVATDSAEATSSAKVASSSAKNKTPTPTPKSTPKTSVTPKTTPKASASSGKQLTIKETGTGWLRVRSTPGSGAEVAKVDVGETFTYTEVQEGWYLIEYETGKEGWVTGQYVEAE
jgi:hypothetical protein